ncbi:MAG: hypothetical protein FJ312_08160 [SAR202 cluster bacterium]|nr:hypothetical protein [SAR202 cluster bacterium]
MDVLWFVIGTAVGAAIAGVAAWARFKLKATSEGIELTTKLRLAEERIEEIKRERLADEQQISHVFASLATDALHKNS